MPANGATVLGWGYWAVVFVTCCLALKWIVKWIVVRRTPFDGAAWRTDVEGRLGVRLRMARRLLAKRALSGMKRSEVVEMLGESLSHPEFTDWQLIYWLAPETSYLKDPGSVYLLIRLSDQDIVRECRIASDG
jgi:hypothetical protein